MNMVKTDLLVRGVLYFILMSLFSRCFSIASLSSLKPDMRGRILSGDQLL
jgi:hypothetical protein